MWMWNISVKKFASNLKFHLKFSAQPINSSIFLLTLYPCTNSCTINMPNLQCSRPYVRLSLDIHTGLFFLIAHHQNKKLCWIIQTGEYKLERNRENQLTMNKGRSLDLISYPKVFEQVLDLSLKKSCAVSPDILWEDYTPSVKALVKISLNFINFIIWILLYFLFFKFWN